MIEYFADQGGEHRFRIKASNGEPVHTSEGYTSAADARRGFYDFAMAVVLTIAEEMDDKEQEGFLAEAEARFRAAHPEVPETTFDADGS